MDYRIYCLIALVGWGVWGFFSKLLTKNMNMTLFIFFATLAPIIFIAIYTFATTQVRFDRFAIYALLIGLISSIATISFYLALAKGPASVVIPFTGLYFIIPAILGFLLLREPLNPAHIIGIILAAIAIILFSI
ncbi:MAG: EamA family transporter [candidate division WOR-3 bacterium]